MVLPKRAFLIHNEIIPLKQNVQASFSNFDTHKSHDIFALIGKNFLAMPLPTGVEYVVSENLYTTTQKGLEIPGWGEDLEAQKLKEMYKA